MTTHKETCLEGHKESYQRKKNYLKNPHINQYHTNKNLILESNKKKKHKQKRNMKT